MGGPFSWPVAEKSPEEAKRGAMQSRGYLPENRQRNVHVYASGEFSPQLTAFFTSTAIFASTSAVNPFSAKAVAHIAPSSRFALSSKLNVAYLVLNLGAGRKKQTILPSLAYAGIPYQVFGERT